MGLAKVRFLPKRKSRRLIDRSQQGSWFLQVMRWKKWKTNRNINPVRCSDVCFFAVCLMTGNREDWQRQSNRYILYLIINTTLCLDSAAEVDMGQAPVLGGQDAEVSKEKPLSMERLEK